MDENNYITEHRKGQHLTNEERHIIEVRFNKDKWSIYAIAKELGRPYNTVKYEIERGTVHLYNGKVSKYKAEVGYAVYSELSSDKKRPKIGVLKNPDERRSVMPKKRKINGEGTVYKYKSGYRGQIVIGTDDNGKPIRKSVSGKTAKEVSKKLVEIKNSLITGMYVAPDEITVCGLAQTLLDEDLALNYIKEGTYHRNKETLKRLKKNPILNNTPIQSLTYVQLQQFLFGETCMSQSIINKVYNMLGRAFKEAVKRKIIIENPMADVKKPNSKKVNIKVRALTRDEEQKLYNVIVHNDVPYTHQMLLSMFTGMRMGEVNALTKNDIDLDAGTITIDKTISRDTKGTAFVSDTTKTEAGTRTIPISSTVLPIVKEILQLCENKEYLFMKNGKNINTSQVNMQFSRIANCNSKLQ